jgi:hypothetical protein
MSGVIEVPRRGRVCVRACIAPGHSIFANPIFSKKRACK